MKPVMNAPPSRSIGEYLGITARGVAMGSADVVPGVSGGTMAFILGIYEELVDSISAFTRRETLGMLLGLRWREALAVLPWRFLLALGAGILAAILSLAKLLDWLLVHQPVYIWSFFFGLVLASVHTVSRRIRGWTVALVISAAVAAVFAWWFVGLVPTQTPETWWFLILSGAIAICAMILPGISGSFVLVILGKYQYVLRAVNEHDILTLVLVAAGAAVGILSFSRVVSYLFRTHHDLTVAVLTGLMLGSLRKIWPWKETLTTMLDRHGVEIPLVQANVLPDGFTSEVLFAALLAIAGIVVVLVMERGAGPATRPEENR